MLWPPSRIFVCLFFVCLFFADVERHIWTCLHWYFLQWNVSICSLLPACGFYLNEAKLTDGIKFFHRIPQWIQELSKVFSLDALLAYSTTSPSQSLPSSLQLQSWHGPPPSFFFLQQISITGSTEAICRETIGFPDSEYWWGSGTPWPCLSPSSRSDTCFIAAWPWLAGLREPQGRCQFMRPNPRLLHIMLISCLKWSFKKKMNRVQFMSALNISVHLLRLQECVTSYYKIHHFNIIFCGL